MTEHKQDFESTLSELETVVEKLENGDLSLEEQLNQYESGIKLANTCRAMLENAKLRVEKLSVSVPDEDD